MLDTVSGIRTVKYMHPAALQSAVERRVRNSALLELANWDLDVAITAQQMGRVGTGLNLLADPRDGRPRRRVVLCTSELPDMEHAVASGVAHHAFRSPIDATELMAMLGAP